MDIGSKVALVTGGGTGIGRATALALAARGARAVAVSYATSREDAEATVRDIEAAGAAARAIRADVRSDAEVRAMVAEVAGAFGGLDILVSNAGTTRYTPLADLEALTDEIWDVTLDTNLRGAFYVCRAAAPHLKAAQGAIVIVGSMAGLRGAGSSLAYSVSKAGAIHLARVLAVALAPEVRVNSVSPGLVETRWRARGGAKGSDAAESARVAARTPLARTVQPGDVADAILALVGAGLVTGQDVVIDGGMSLTYD